MGSEIIDVRAADLQEEMTKYAFRFVRSDEDGGYPANIVASGASKYHTAPKPTWRAFSSPRST
jgi:hypothetical protein